MVTVVKIAPSSFRLGQLQSEINSNATIVPSCMSITTAGPNINLEFAATLSGAEDTELDSVLTAHAPAPEEVSVTELPFSDIGNKEKIAVHSSYKPNSLTSSNVYAVWTGAGDTSGGNVGEGDRLEFHMTPTNPEETVTIDFHPDNGRVWIHEGYIQFTGAGFGDYMTAEIRSKSTNVQTSTDLDFTINGSNFLIPAVGGPGTGTHGFADANIALIPQTFSMDGEWDFDTVNGLQPNLVGTGGYRIANAKKTVHKFINAIPLFGTSSYTIFSSDDTMELTSNYEIRVRVYNVSDGDWNLCAFIECYRERTAKLQ